VVDSGFLLLGENYAENRLLDVRLCLATSGIVERVPGASKKREVGIPEKRGIVLWHTVEFDNDRVCQHLLVGSSLLNCRREGDAC
jgi:hypothetical protein